MKKGNTALPERIAAIRRRLIPDLRDVDGAISVRAKLSVDRGRDEARAKVKQHAGVMDATKAYMFTIVILKLYSHS